MFDLSLWWRANPWNVAFQNFLQWPIYIINSVDENQIKHAWIVKSNNQLFGLYQLSIIVLW